MQSTEWRSIPGYDGLYEASNAGMIRSLSPHPKGRTASLHELKPQTHRNGYLNVGLFREGTRKVIGVHRLVALAFHGEPTGPEVRHLDGDKTNNRPDNLKWGTHVQNEGDKEAHGTRYSHFRGRTTCSRDHEYTEANTYRYAGRRHCRTCQAERARSRRAAA